MECSTLDGKSMENVEKHPLEPFLPKNAKILMLGSFPPPQNRWCMHFYYPNFINDMWRILGKVFFDDRNAFVFQEKKTFNQEKIVDFLQNVGIGIYDTATEVRRLKGNASDAFLEVVKPTDVKELLKKIPLCKAVVTTGTLATKTLCEMFGAKEPPVGGRSPFRLESRELFLYRTPSSSRAYPLAFDKKVEAYRQMFLELGMVRFR